MERNNEVILQNTTLENVFRYLYDKLKRIGGETIERKTDDGTIHLYCIQYVHPSEPNKIEVKYTTTVEPQGNVEKSHGYWHDSIAMRFEGWQLQTNTVLLKGECHCSFILSTFDEYWADLLTAFGAVQPMNLIADNHGGTITYKRNEQGQTIITGGTVNPGYHAELGRGAAIMPDQVPLNHTTGPFQPGWYDSGTQGSIIEVISETLAGLAKSNAPQAAQSVPAKLEQSTVENTRIPVGKYDDLCIRWVNRPYIPRQTKEEFLYEHAGELDKKTFDRILKDAHARGIIDKDPGKNGRYKPKTVS
jgi:hypothetical protein